MELQSSDIFVAREPLQRLTGEKFPVKVAYDLAKLTIKLADQFKVIDEVRNGLIKKYGDKGEKGQITVAQDSPNWDKFIAEFNELMEQKVEVVFAKVKLPEKVAATCDKCNHNMDKAFEIEPKILMALDKFIEVG